MRPAHLRTPGRRHALAVVVAAVAVASATLAASACVGDEPTVTSAGGRGDGSSASDDAAPAADGPAADGPAADGPAADASAEAGTAACGERDTTPCGCGAVKSCCVLEDGTSPCQVLGNEEPGDGCTSLNIIQCVAGTCPGGQTCCFLGEVGPDAVCPMRISRRSTTCEPVDASSPESACTSPSNVKNHFMCQTDGDCAKFDAGTCQSARMDDVGRVVGICRP